VLYQIFTEDVNRPEITRILDSRFTGYTLVPASSHWQGIAEPSVIAEIETTDRDAVDSVADQIRVANHQQAVLVEAIPSISEVRR
jgi:hypothetical protein